MAKWTQREEMHMDYDSDPTGRNGSSVTVYSVSADGVKTDIQRTVKTERNQKTTDQFTCRESAFDTMIQERAKLGPWLESMLSAALPKPGGDVQGEGK